VNTKQTNITDILPEKENERPDFVKRIGKATYEVNVYFSTTSKETMSDKIIRMLRNEVNQSPKS
jgi:hypothetical protein